MTDGSTIATDAEAPQGSYQPAEAIEPDMDTSDAESFHRHIWIRQRMHIAASRTTPKNLELEFPIDLGRLSRRRHMQKLNRGEKDSEDS